MQVAASVGLLLLLLFSPTAVAQRMAITNGNIKSAVSDWTTNSTSATTKYGDIASWNVAAVTSMAELFSYNPAFNQNIASWNTAKVSNMDRMFYEAAAFNQDIAAWNTASVSNMYSMFFEAAAFNQNIASWNTAKVSSMDWMFREATTFNQDIGGWNTARVSNMGYVCAAFGPAACHRGGRARPVVDAARPLCARA